MTTLRTGDYVPWASIARGSWECFTTHTSILATMGMLRCTVADCPRPMAWTSVRSVWRYPSTPRSRGPGLSSAASPTSRDGFFVLWFSGNSPTSLHWCDRSPGGGQLASHNRVQVRVTSLYRVPENSVRSAITMRLSWSLVGLLNRHPTCWSSYFMGRVPHRFSCSPTIYGSTP
jgi:hypothetical protein